MSYEKAIMTQSPLENRFLKDCITVGLLVEPQHAIGPIHADFAIVSKKVAIECDSKQYHTSEEAKLADEERDEIYKRNGWSVIRIRGAAIMKGGEEIAQLIRDGRYDGYPHVEIVNYHMTHDADHVEELIIKYISQFHAIEKRK